ncbi:MAG TPA: hypothetical protein VIK53_13190 [Verrucomicrobiae bacterium]
MQSNLKIHLFWVVGVLTGIIVLLLSVDWSGIKDLAGILNFALGLTSLVLAIVAIIYGFIANNSFSGTVSKIEAASSQIIEVAKTIPAKLSVIEQTTADFQKSLSATSQAKTSEEPPKPKDAEVEKFADAVISEFLRASSWNGLKVMYLCRFCCSHKLEFDLKQICSLDSSMSYDYALGYLVASASASFFTFTSSDNLKFVVHFMPTKVAEKIDSAITGRLKFVGLPNKNDFEAQLRTLDLYLESLRQNKLNP